MTYNNSCSRFFYTFKKRRKQMKKNYSELSFTDDFMFCKVLVSQPNLCKELLELLLGIEIRKIEMAESQKTIEMTYDGKGIRFDVYTEDEKILYMTSKCRLHRRKICLNVLVIIREW